MADVLLGKAYPSGKLATTWAAYEEYCSVGDFACRDDTRYHEGIFVGYRYFDAVGKRPLFPFGHGLGYTTFSVDRFACSSEGTSIEVSAEVANTGGFAGKETLQVYVSCPSGRLAREPKALVGFVKTQELAPRQAERVSVRFDVRDLAGYDARGARYVLEPGTPLVSGRFAAAVTQGVQGHPGRGVTLKHYAANNQETNRYANNSMVSERALREIYLRGFELCVREAAPRAVMTSYNLINGVHTSESRDLTVALRDEFGFDGIIMTDWVVGGELLTGKTKHPAPDAARVAAAGCSLFMPGSKADFEQILSGLRTGAVTRKALALNAAYLARFDRVLP